MELSISSSVLFIKKKKRKIKALDNFALPEAGEHLQQQQSADSPWLSRGGTETG